MIAEDGEIRPLMLSDLISAATKALEAHGDIPVGVDILVSEYEYEKWYILPVSDEPTVRNPKWLQSHWEGKFSKAFCVEGGIA